MSDTREASWYEIALTHSQIVKIFVGLLLCLVGRVLLRRLDRP